jgi:hypothetical protein
MTPLADRNAARSPMPTCTGGGRLSSNHPGVVSGSLSTECTAMVRRLSLDDSCSRDRSIRSRSGRRGPVATNRRRRSRPTGMGQGVLFIGHRHPERFRATLRFPWRSQRIRCHSLGSRSRQVLGDPSWVSDLASRLPSSPGPAALRMDRSDTTQGSRNRRCGSCRCVFAARPCFGLGPPTLDPPGPPGSP